MSKTLLDKAKGAKLPYHDDPTRDEINLALAWAGRRISLSQVQAALGNKGATSAYLKLARALRAHLHPVGSR